MGKGGVQTPKISIKDSLDFALNVATQYLTYGAVGYENGKFGKGITTRALDESIGEITGRNAMRKQMMDSNAAADKAAAQAKLDAQNEALQRYRADVAASRSAQAIRNTATARASGGGGGTASGALGSDMEKDFLGT